MVSTTVELITRLALGLTLRDFAEEPTLRDVQLLVHGRVHLWPSWGQDPDVTRAVARFLAVRPDTLADDGALLHNARRALEEASDFEAVHEGWRELSWDAPYRLVAGAPLDERLERWFMQMEKQRGRATSPASPRPPSSAPLALSGGGQTYRVPRAHVPAPSPAPALRTAEPIVDELLDRDALAELARAIDRALEGPPIYEPIGVGAFLDRFVARHGAQPQLGSGGITKLALAPTGTGKSVFARLLALHVARRAPVTLVVPDIQAVWRETARLRDAAHRARLDIRIVAVSSWRNLARHLGDYLEQPDRDEAWALETVGYTCHLAAYTEEGDGPAPGDEPCTRLRQRDERSDKERKVSCPFASECGRFSAFQRAVEAEILVVNHHAFLGGRVPIEVAVDGDPPRKLTTAELVLRRSAVVLIDEIDALQNTAIAADSRGLVLSSRGRLSKPYQLLFEVERRRAEERLDRSVSFERGRSALARITHEAERLAELINNKELDWPTRGRMTWREAHDAWLSARLFTSDDQGLSRVSALFDDQPIADDPRAEALRLALRPLGPGLGDGTRMSDVQARIMLSLEAWELEGRRAGQEERARVMQRLIQRAVLLQLDQALDHLRPQLPGLEHHEVQQAADLRDELLGYAPWQPSPTGPLGRRMQGYAFTERFGQQGALETRVLSGDPHGLIRELGGLVAQALAGTARVVLGFSATCRFRGSPRADVLGEVVGWVVDRARNVTVRGAGVGVRISGVGARSERMEAAAAAASELWSSTLSHYLEHKSRARETAGRARAMLVTGSYHEARAAAEGLRRAAGSTLPVRFLVSSEADAGSHPDALSRARLETFGHVPGPAVLVGPLSVVARGHNILQPGSQLSALSGIFVLTRPVPPSHDADRFLAHLAYNAHLVPESWQGTPGRTVSAERRAARARLRALQRSPATFRHMDDELRRELVCDVLVELAQLAGRARRGGTPVELFFVDGAFADELVPWDQLVRDVLEWWRERGWLDEMVALHGAFVSGLAEYSGVELAGVEQRGKP